MTSREAWFSEAISSSCASCRARSASMAFHTALSAKVAGWVASCIGFLEGSLAGGQVRSALVGLVDARELLVQRPVGLPEAPRSAALAGFAAARELGLAVLV